jgi:hypothetical protein
MPQISLYVDEETLELIKSGADTKGLSQSKYVAETVRDAYYSGRWPDGYAEWLLSEKKEPVFFPEAKSKKALELEINKLRKPMSKDLPREEL